MWIDLDDEDFKYITHQEIDSKRQFTGKERIIIPSFDLHSREVGSGNGKDRVTIFAYEIRCAPTKAYMLQNVFL